MTALKMAGYLAELLVAHLADMMAETMAAH